MMGLVSVGVEVGVCSLTACHIVQLSAHPLPIMTLIAPKPKLRRSLSSQKQSRGTYPGSNDIARIGCAHFLKPILPIDTTEGQIIFHVLSGSIHIWIPWAS